MDTSFQATLRNLNKIIERESKSTTYKFALLRGTIDIIRDNSPLIKKEGNSIQIPLGLLVEKWIVYYFPIFESPFSLRQIHTNRKLAFEDLIISLVNLYKGQGGFKEFYIDFLNKGIKKEGKKIMVDLVKTISKTITEMPMKHLGSSISGELYSIFSPNKNRRIYPTHISKSIDFVSGLGFYTIPDSYFQVFKEIGGFISGQNSIIFHWAQFSANSKSEKVSIHQAIEPLLSATIIPRETGSARSILDNLKKSRNKIICVWSGEELEKYEVDHIIPYAFWNNNDLWNLLPSKPSINNNKRDKIATPEQIENSKDNIISYWQWYMKTEEDRFIPELKKNLIGNTSLDNWERKSIDKLKELTNYYIEERGYQFWQL